MLVLVLPSLCDDDDFVMDSAASRHGMQRCLLSSHYFPAFGLEWNKMEEEVVIKSYHVIRKKELKRKLHREHKRESS